MAKFTWLALLASTGLALAAGSGNGPILPSEDPWYSAPAGYEWAAPGTILKIREAPGNLTKVINESSKAYNLLFRTSDSQSKPYWGVTTLFVPKKTNRNRLLSYNLPYVSANVDYSPSVTLYQQNPIIWEDIHTRDVQTGLSNGWYVVVPDYQGPNSDFGASVSGGHQTLDSIRAALHSGFGLTNETKLGLWGYSVASIATLWAMELQTQYAPELNFLGACVGGLVPNLTTTFRWASGTEWSAFVNSGYIGLTNQYPAAKKALHSILKPSGPYNRTEFLNVSNELLPDAFNTYKNQTMWNYFVDGYASTWNPTLQRAVENNYYIGTHGIPQMPMYVYKPIHDLLSPINETDDLVQHYCDYGVKIEYQRNTIGGHLADQWNGRPDAVAWLQRVMAGNFTPPGQCVTKTVSINYTDNPN